MKKRLYYWVTIGLAVLMVVVALAGCSANDSGKEGERDEAAEVEDEDTAQTKGSDSTASFGGAKERYTTNIGEVTISFDSVEGLRALEPTEYMEIVRQDFYSADASHSIDVGYVPARWNNPDDDPHTGEEYRNYPWEKTVTPLIVTKTDDITIGDWSGFYYEYHDNSGDFNACGYILYNSAGDKVDLTQIERDGCYLPVENLRIE